MISKDDIMELEYIADCYMVQTKNPNQDMITFMGLVVGLFRKLEGVKK